MTRIPAGPVSTRSLRDIAYRVEIKRVWENNYRLLGPQPVYKQLRAVASGPRCK